MGLCSVVWWCVLGLFFILVSNTEFFCKAEAEAGNLEQNGLVPSVIVNILMN